MINTPIKTRSYEIGVTYCDDIVFTHKHDELRDATEEYAEMLREAIEPTGEHEEARHVRRVHLFILDEFDRIVRKIDSGILPCEDRPNG